MAIQSYYKMKTSFEYKKNHSIGPADPQNQEASRTLSYTGAK